VDAAQVIPEIVAALAEFVAAAEPYFIGFDPPLDLRAIAAAVRLLPAILDIGECLGLRRSGAVASFLWDEPHMLRPEWDARIRNMTYYRASLKYPALIPLAPRRPVNAVVCLHCGGSGRCSGPPARLAIRVVCYGGGLGWLPDKDASPWRWSARPTASRVPGRPPTERPRMPQNEPRGSRTTITRP